MRLYTHTHTHTHTGNLKNKKTRTILIIFIILITTILIFNAGVYAAYVFKATEVSYTKSNGTTVSVKEALDELYTIQLLAKAVSVGDYVAYDAGTHSYTSPTGTGSSHGNGSGNQTFTSSSSLKWRVLGWDEETGGVMLISESRIGSFTMKGAIGYLYAEQELNEICKIYGYGTGANTSKKFNYITGDTVEGTKVGTIAGSGARSINVDDVNKICGVTPSTALTGSYGKAPYTKSIYYPTTSTSTGYSTSATSRTDVNTYYSYKIWEHLDNTTEIYKMLFGDTIMYWLASRSVYSSSSYAHFNIHMISNGNLGYYTLGDGSGSNFGELPCNYGVRPIVYLKSGIQTNGKNASGAWNIIDK